MVFSSVVFLFLFLPFTLAGYYLIDRRFKNIFLLLTSLFFYAWGEPKFVFMMIFSIFMNYIFGLLVVYKKEKNYQRLILFLMVLFNFSIFFVFKYLNFTIQNINFIFGDILPQTDIVLPIGISFFTFQAMSYVFDVYRGKGTVQKNPLNVALYVTLFPQLIAGPIVRYETVANEIRSRQETLDDFALGIRRFILGLSKKVILSNSVAIIADKAFNCGDYAQLSVLMAWLGAISYTLQIYFDFSGYSDMAIGLGLMFGFHFNENFNYPYISKSVTEFWRRWHISLSTWFRDYLYIPLGGSRVKNKSRLYFNMFVVWLFTGVWHGAAWNFIVWGLMYFVLQVIEKAANIPQRFHSKSLIYLWQAFTMFAVVCGWVIFRAEGMEDAAHYLMAMFGGLGNRAADVLSRFLVKDYLILFIIAVIGSTPLPKKIAISLQRNRYVDTTFGLLACLLLILTISYIINTPYDPFIYFNF